MRKLHPSYESFVKEHTPKYGKTFIEWFADNQKIGDVDLLAKLQENNKCFIKNDFDFPGHTFYEENYIPYFKDSFSKKLQLCQNQINNMITADVKYDLGSAADIMDLYEDIINEVCSRDNVYVCGLPSGLHKNKPYTTSIFKYDSINDLIEELSSGIVIVYYFRVLDDFSIQIRYSKREPLTRTVLFEKENTIA